MLSFTARRRKPELLRPARPTPHEYKAVSDVDGQPALRFYPTGIEFFRARCHAASPGVVDEDPVTLIRAALAEALVSYYPLAGRLLEVPVPATGGTKMLVECTAEGVVFVEADADVRLEEFGQPLVPPYPCVEELLCDDVCEPQEVVVGKPLLFLQVTRFRNNSGLAIGYRFCHTIIDAFGMAQLLDDVYKLARGEALTLLPVWGRELLTARAPASVTDNHSWHDQLPAAGARAEDIIWKTPLEHMVNRHFRFGPREMAAMRSEVPASLLKTTTVFELVTAAWRCRTAALEYAPRQGVRVVIASNARRSWKPRSPIPLGFYGNALILRTAEATADELCGRPLRHALGLVRGSRFDVTDEYMETMLADLLARRPPPFYSQYWTYAVGDATSLRQRVAKLGSWDRAGGGITVAGPVAPASLLSYYGRYKRGGGKDDCVVVSMCLPPAAMNRFALRVSAWENKSRVTSSM